MAINIPHLSKESRKDDNFLMDFENYALELYMKKPPIGITRYKDKEWEMHMKAVIEDSDTTWDKYVVWVKAGGGDEWFQEDLETTPPPPPLQPMTSA